MNKERKQTKQDQLVTPRDDSKACSYYRSKYNTEEHSWKIIRQNIGTKIKKVGGPYNGRNIKCI